MRKRLLLIPVMALVVAACGGGSDADEVGSTTTEGPATTQAPATTATPTTAAPVAATEVPVAVVSSDLGDILADDQGNTLYLFLPDAQGPSVCNGDCAGIWPPLTVTAAAGAGVDASLLGTAARDDGSEQATYNGWPLYYFASDAAAGDTNGQGVNEVWYVVDPAGEAIGATMAEAAAELAISVVSSDLGDILADDQGNTLYLFLPDAQGASVCNGDCAGIWPPLTVAAASGDGVDAGLLGTVTRDDGSEQATYNGWPLYYFASDAAAGDTNGQGVNDVWYVVDPAGDAVGQ